MNEFVEILGYAFIAVVLFAIGYVFVKLLATGLSALTNNDD